MYAMLTATSTAAVSAVSNISHPPLEAQQAHWITDSNGEDQEERNDGKQEWNGSSAGATADHAESNYYQQFE